MTIKNFYFLCRWFNHLSKTKETDAKVDAITQEAIKQIDKTTASLKQVGKLQTLVMQKTTSYYIGKAMGAIK